MASISGNLEVFAQRDRSPEEYKTVTKNALENVYEIERILNNLLLMSGLKKLEDSHQTFRVDELIWKINESFPAKNNGDYPPLKINLEVQKQNLLEFTGNETLLYLALFNIIENAVKYSEGNQVKISLQENENHLQILVEDSGKGIPKEDLEKISETFFRAKNVGNIKGSGIGLSLSKSIFEHHKIQMTITSEENNGTTVELIFPKK